MRWKQNLFIYVTSALALSGYAALIAGLFLELHPFMISQGREPAFAAYLASAAAILFIGLGLFLLGHRLDTDNRRLAFEFLAHRNFTDGILKSLGQNELLEHITHETSALLGADRSTLYLIKDGKLRSAIAEGDVFIELDMGQGIAGYVAATCKPHFTNAPYKDALFSRKTDEKIGYRTRNVAAAPILLDGKVMGVLSAINKRGAFTTRDLDLMGRLAKQAGVVLAKAELERRIRQEKEVLQSIFMGMSDGLYIIDKSFRVKRLNQPMLEQYGDSTGRFCHETFYGLDSPCPGCPAPRTLQTGGVGIGDMCSPDGRHFEVASSPLKDSGEGAKGAILARRDVSWRDVLENRVVQTEKLSAIGQLVSGVAHELNNPLTGVIGYSELLMESDLDDAARKDVRKILENAVRSQAIVKKLLTFARQTKPEKEAVDINELTARTLKLQEYEFEGSGVVIRTGFERNLPKIQVDPMQIQQALLNLTVNARQAMKNGGVLEVTTSLLKKDGAPESDLGARATDMVRIRIKDTGEGISQENLSRIFTPFFTTKPVGSGTGLGLSISYGIVQEHGGDLTVRSKAGEGAVFLLDLPVCESAKESLGTDKNFEEKPAAPARPLRILAVDDEPHILELIERTLSQDGHRVTCLDDPRAVVEMLSGEAFDLALLDLQMPGMDGFELYEKIAREAPQMIEKIAFASGDTMSEKTRAFFQRTGRPHIDKPFDMEELKRMVARSF